jgi:hypothetical protein
MGIAPPLKHSRYDHASMWPTWTGALTATGAAGRMEGMEALTTEAEAVLLRREAIGRLISEDVVLGMHLVDVASNSHSNYAGLCGSASSAI